MMDSRSDVVEACRNVIEANDKRAQGYVGLTLHEAQEIAVLRIRLDDLAIEQQYAARTGEDVSPTGRAEAS